VRVVLNDVLFEAAFLRAGLLVGLVHERDVPAWAERVLAGASTPAPRLADVLTTRVELSAMREALRPLGESVAPDRVFAALLTALAVDGIVGRRPPADELRILGQIRQECRPPADVSARIKVLQDRAMLAAAGLRGQSAPTAEELAAFLDDVRVQGFFRFHLDGVEECAAFVAALSRKIVRDRTAHDRSGHAGPRVWRLEGPSGGRSAVVLNESAVAIALREFAPVPLVSRIPYPDPGAHAREVIDEATASPLGSEEARRKLAVP